MHDFEMTKRPFQVALEGLDGSDGNEKTPQFSSIPASSNSPALDEKLVSTTRRRLQISGVVQGVGFRPFLYNLAHRLGLSGWVRNTSTGVELELQGSTGALDHFLDHLRHNAPPLARILDITTISIPPLADQAAGLEIRASQSQSGRTLISPDVATCPSCLTELFDPADRRYEYPFTNCTHCGPRFTITLDLPYDRPLTTMANFPLCPECAAEYQNPADRRFHAQPVACPVCGPKIWYNASYPVGDSASHPGGYSAEEAGITLPVDAPIDAEALAVTVHCLNQRHTVALKGLGGFHLACRADNSDAVKKLRVSKSRPAKPLAIMVRGLDEAAEFCHVSPAERALLAAPEAPIVLLRKRADVEAGVLAPEIAPQNGYVGVMLPYTPLHHLLLQAAGGPLVMTSGNRSGEPLCIDNAEAWSKLRPYADGFLLHNRPIARRCDDSVMFVPDLGDQTVVQPVRRSRGLAPMPVLLPAALSLNTPLVAAGADLKNVSALAVDRHVFLTQHIGDLSNFQAREEQTSVLTDLERLFRIKPQAVVCDLHPDYASSRYARRRAAEEGLPLIEVQHHHAHIAGCLAENNHLGVAIGLSFDGTGYGTDGCIWGGEVLLADLKGFQRLFHLEYLPLPGGDAAIRHPNRIALAYLRTLLPELNPASLLPGLTKTDLNILETMLARGLNTPLTSSMGRLFDAASALVDLCDEATFEGQAAIALEAAALDSDFNGPGYDFVVIDGQIRLAALFSQLVADRQSRVPVPDIARRFHQTVAQMAVAAALSARTLTNGLNTPVNHIALSGGVWQNRLLLEMTVPLLHQAGFEVLLHHAVPTNDGGLAYGQAAVAAAQLATRSITPKE